MCVSKTRCFAQSRCEREKIQGELMVIGCSVIGHVISSYNTCCRGDWQGVQSGGGVRKYIAQN